MESKKRGMIICNLVHKKWELYVIFFKRCERMELLPVGDHLE